MRKKYLTAAVALLCCVGMAYAVDGYSNDFSSLDDISTIAPLGPPYLDYGDTAVSVDSEPNAAGYMTTVIAVANGSEPINATDGTMTFTWRFDYTGGGTPPGPTMGMWFRVYSGTYVVDPNDPNNTGWQQGAAAGYFHEVTIDNGWGTANWDVDSPDYLEGGIPLNPTSVYAIAIQIVYWDLGYTPCTWSFDDLVITGFPASGLPVADAGASQADIPCGDAVTLDGSGSYDTDPNGYIVNYMWSWPGGSAQSTSPTVPVQLPCGASTIVTLVVEDNENNFSDPDTVTMTVLDCPPDPYGYTNDMSALGQVTSGAGIPYLVDIGGDDAIEVEVTESSGARQFSFYPPCTPVDITNSEYTITLGFAGTLVDPNDPQAEVGGWLRVFDSNGKKLGFFHYVPANSGLVSFNDLLSNYNPDPGASDPDFDPTLVTAMSFDPFYVTDAKWVKPYYLQVGHLEFVALPGSAPVADAGLPQTVNCTWDGGVVTLDGSESYDDGEIVRYLWKEGAVVVADTDVPTIDVGLSCGAVHSLSLEVMDDTNLWSTPAFVDITVNAGPPPAVADSAYVPFSIKAGDISGTSQHPLIVPTENVALELVDRGGPNTDPTQDRQLLFDALSNVYFINWHGALYKLSPSLDTLWTSSFEDPPTSGNYTTYSPAAGRAATLIVGERWVYTLGGQDRPTSPWKGWVTAFDKSTGHMVWETQLTDGVYFEDFDSERSRTLMTLYNDKLYIIGAPDDAGLGNLATVRVYQVDASTGVIDWVTPISVGGRWAVNGHMAFVPDLYATGIHGMFYSSRSDGEADGLSDAVGLRIDPTTGATVEWGTDAGYTSLSRMIYSSDTGWIYGVCEWNWAGKAFWWFDKNTGTIGGARGGDYALQHRGESAALSYDGVTVYTGSDWGRVYRYTPIDPNTAQVDTEEFSYDLAGTADARAFGPRSVMMEDANGDEIIATARIEYRWWDMDPNDPTNDDRYQNEIVLLNVSDAVAGGTDEQLDDGPILIDNVQVVLNSAVVWSEDFESYDPNDAFFPPAADPTWADASSSPAPGTQVLPAIIDFGGDYGKVLKLDPYGGHGEISAVIASLPTGYGGNSGDEVIIRWQQLKVDQTEKIFVGPGGWPIPGGTFQGDGTEADYPIDEVCALGSDPGGSTAAGGTSAMVSADGVTWQEVEARLFYHSVLSNLTIWSRDLPSGGFSTNGGTPPLLSTQDPVTQVKFEMSATSATSSGYVPPPLVPIASLATSTVDTGETAWGNDRNDWDWPDALAVAPNGDLYYMQFGIGGKRYSRVRITGTTPPQYALGDMNCDGFVNNGDIDPFVLAMN